ncbi:MAG TPA: DegT/DnrJ/EryC1/StrS family aminotransferase [Ignavibacteria bacterium]
MKVPLLDLKAQYNSIKKDIDETLIKVAESQYFILGPDVEKLEKSIGDYIQSKYTVGVSSGTDALLIALMAIDIKPGDEVIIPTYSFFATAGVVSRLNAVPVFCDSDPVTFNISPSEIEKKITPKTKAIIPVHLYGQCADMTPILAIAKKYNLKVIEDGAQAIGAQYSNGKYAGTFGDIGCFSFFPSKNLGCFGDGGMVTTNDEDLYNKLKILRVHGSKPKYYHKIIGGNFRLDAIQAAVLNVKLPHLDNWSEKRRKNADFYTKLFVDSKLASQEGILELSSDNKVLLPKPVYKNINIRNYHIYNQYVIRINKRDDLRKYLNDSGIGCEIYYPVPFHLQECYSSLNYKTGDFPVAENCANSSLALPIYPELTMEQISFVVDSINNFIKNN